MAREIPISGLVVDAIVVLRGAKMLLKPNLDFNSSEGCLPRELLLVGQNLKCKFRISYLLKVSCSISIGSLKNNDEALNVFFHPIKLLHSQLKYLSTMNMHENKIIDFVR